MPSTVFISHSSKDRETAGAICARLESAGIDCWMAPRDIELGATWTKGIMQGLEACRVLVLVFSEHANASDHVHREVAKAFSSGLAVIPFRIKDVSSNQSLGYFLDTIQWLDASDPPLQKHLGTLSERVKKKLLREDATRQSPKRLEPEKISVVRLPVTGTDVFGREEDLAFLDQLSPEAVAARELAGEPITGKLTRAPDNNAPIGGLKVFSLSGWFAARPSGTQQIYKLYRERLKSAEHLAAYCRAGAGDCQLLIGTEVSRGKW
jgi:hypothetical protein